MTQYNDVNSGIVSPNDFKQNDKQPDIRGRANIEGVWYWVSGWHKTKGNNHFTTMAYTVMTQDEVDKMMAKRAAKNAPQQAAQNQQQRQQPQSREDAPAQQQQQAQAPTGNEPPMDFDDDIPF